MALSNRERIARGMEHLREGLAPFAEQEIKARTAVGCLVLDGPLVRLLGPVPEQPAGLTAPRGWPGGKAGTAAVWRDRKAT